MALRVVRSSVAASSAVRKTEAVVSRVDGLGSGNRAGRRMGELSGGGKGKVAGSRALRLPPIAGSWWRSCRGRRRLLRRSCRDVAQLHVVCDHFAREVVDEPGAALKP